MRKWVLLLSAVIGVVAGLTAGSDDAAACGRRRCRSACYDPRPFCVPVAPQPAPSRAVTIKGRTYFIHPVGEQEESPEEALRGKRSVFARSSGIPDADIFDGQVRKIAKVTIFDGPPTRTFDSVSELRAFLPDDQDMKALGIGRGPDVDRVKQEQVKVTVKACIYTFLKEGDNDYHVIIGDPPGTPNRKYMNVEVSGIPDIGTDENRNRLWKVRRAFKQEFQLQDEGPDRYHPLSEPVPVKITGSLFWDVEHYPKTVGPKFASPGTAWEIHPVSDIEFLD
jgi:hypothetical protein